MISQRFLLKFRLFVFCFFIVVTIKSYGYKIPVLCYHRVTDTDNSRFTISSKIFAKQMLYLYLNDYIVLSVDELVSFMNNGFIDDGKKRIVITFDDDYPQTLINVLPVLKKFGFRITNFIYTKFLDEMSLWGWYRKNNSDLIVFQSHTVNHLDLTVRKPSETLFSYRKRIFSEVKKSKEIIDKQLSTDVCYLAYPYGTSNLEVVKMVRLAGYKAMFSAQGGYVTKKGRLDAIPRLTVFRRFKIKDFVKLVSGRM